MPLRKWGTGIGTSCENHASREERFKRSKDRSISEAKKGIERTCRNKYKVEILPTAWEDLKSIEDYYLLQFGVESAMKVTDQILNSIERLELYPNFGSLTPDKWLNRKGYHMIISERYVSIYRLIEKTVYIYHIADTQTEYTKLFS